MSDRVRIPEPLARQVHSFALRDGRSFDGGAKRLLELGLKANAAPAAVEPENLNTIPGLVAAVEKSIKMATAIADAGTHHCRDRAVREVPELAALVHGITVALRDFSNGAAQALNALPARHRAA